MLKITKQELSSAVQTVIAGAAKRSTVDWYDTILFECTGERVIIAAGSAAGFVWRSFPAEGDVFRVAVSAKEISEVCSTSQSETLTITQEGNKLTIVGERGRLSLACNMTSPEVPGGWPSLPAMPDGPHFVVTSGELHRSIKATIPVTDENSARYSLGSVSIVTDSDQVRCYATDGRAAASVTIACENPDAGQFSLLLPDVGMTILSGMLRGLGDGVAVEVYRCGSHIAFVGGGSVAYLCEAAGRFPEVQRILDEYRKKPSIAAFSLRSADIRAALREAVIGYDVGSTTGRTVLLVSDGNWVRVLSNAHSDNDMDILVPCSAASGDGGAITIDHAYLAKLCSASGETVDVRICEGGALLLSNDAGYTAIAMGCSWDDANQRRADDARRAGVEFLVGV